MSVSALGSRKQNPEVMVRFVRTADIDRLDNAARITNGRFREAELQR